MPDDRLYNSALLNNYIELLKQDYPSVNTNDILCEAGIESWELDPGNWFDQEAVNRFQKAVVEKTGNPNIAREVGRSAAERVGTIMRQAALSLLSPSNLYALTSKIAARYSKAIETQSKKISNNSHEITIVYKPGVRPERFQCLNLQGYLEAMCFVFYSKIPRIDHTECLFEGAKRCRYVIQWEPAKSQILRTARNVFSFLSICYILLVLLLKWPADYIFPCIIATLLISLLCVYFEKNELVQIVSKQDFKPHDVLDSHNKYYHSINLINDVASTLSKNTSVAKVLRCVSDILLGLNYPTGLIYTFDLTKDNPRFKEVYIFSNEYRSTIDNLRDMCVSSKLSDDRLKQTLVKDFTEIENVFPETITTSLSNRNMVPDIYLPIVFEDSLLGMIFINKADKSLQASDHHLLNTIASQAALSITNISFYGSLLKSETLRLERDFVTVASHEMHTPIQIINLAYQDIGMTLSQLGLIDSDLSESLESLEQAVVKLNQISSNVLNFSKLKGDIEFAAIGAHQLVDAIKTETKYIASTFGHSVSYDTALAPISIYCHADTIIQLVTNLIENSAKYTPQKGHIKVSIDRTPGEFIIRICDNGIGIPKKYHQKIFKKFFQINACKSGCGLGLSYCQDVLAKHGGYFSVESPLFPEEKLRKGSCITVHLPIKHHYSEDNFN